MIAKVTPIQISAILKNTTQFGKFLLCPIDFPFNVDFIILVLLFDSYLFYFIPRHTNSLLLIMIRQGSELWWFSFGTEGSFTKWQICLRCGSPTKLHRYLAFMWTFCCINVAYILIIVLLLLVFAIASVCCIQPNYEGSVLHPCNSFTPCHCPSMVDI